MEKAHATLRFLRMSPRKVRLVANLVRGLDLDNALAQLTFNVKDASEPVKKLIESAAANAVNNNGLSRDLLFVETITVDDGPTMKRFTPRAQGRATTIRKRSSHVNVVLAERKSKKADVEAKAVVKKREKKPALEKKSSDEKAVSSPTPSEKAPIDNNKKENNN